MKKKSLSRQYAFCMLILCAIFTLSVVLLFASRKPRLVPSSTETDSPVYVYVTEPIGSSESTEAPSSQGWTLRDYEGQIGIFDDKGSLCFLLDTYVKTLPKADQALLREGIYAENEERLRSLIEDYTE